MFNTKIKSSISLLSPLALILFIGGFSTNALAILIDPNVVITGSAGLSLSNPSVLANATQSGSVSSIVSGVITTSTLTSTLNTTTITGTNPLTNTLTSIGDGFGIGFTANGTGVRGANAANIDNLFGDYSFNIQNNSLIDTFTVNLKLDFSEFVDAQGDDAFAQSQIRLADAATSTELLFLDVISDTVNGNHKHVYKNASDLGSGQGGVLSNTGSLLLSFLLAPGMQINLGDTSFEVRLFGGAIGGGDLFSAVVSSKYTVASVEKVQITNVDEPQSIFLIFIGFVLLGLVKRPLMFQVVRFG